MTAIIYHTRPATDTEREWTAHQLRLHTEQALGIIVGHEPFGLLAYEDNFMVGSIVGKIYFQWLHVDLIWVAEAHRRHGIGRDLMRRAEIEARKRQLNGIEVWTQSWQAPEFYRKLGFEEMAAFEDFAPGRKRHIFRKYLTKAPA